MPTIDPRMQPHLFDPPLPMGQLDMFDMPSMPIENPSPNTPVLAAAVIEVEGVELTEEKSPTPRMRIWLANVGSHAVRLEQQQYPLYRWTDRHPEARPVSGAYVAGSSVDVRYDGQIIGVASSLTNAVKLALSEANHGQPPTDS